MAPRCGGQAVPGIDRGSHRGPTIVGASDPREPTSGSGGRAAGRGYSDDVDELGRPVQRAWQDLLILAAVLSEVVLTVLFDSGSGGLWRGGLMADRKSTRLNSSHVAISYAVFCLKKKNNK